MDLLEDPAKDLEKDTAKDLVTPTLLIAQDPQESPKLPIDLIILDSLDLQEKEPE